MGIPSPAFCAYLSEIRQRTRNKKTMKKIQAKAALQAAKKRYSEAALVFSKSEHLNPDPTSTVKARREGCRCGSCVSSHPKWDEISLPLRREIVSLWNQYRSI